MLLLLFQKYLTKHFKNILVVPSKKSFIYFLTFISQEFYLFFNLYQSMMIYNRKIPGQKITMFLWEGKSAVYILKHKKIIFIQVKTSNFSVHIISHPHIYFGNQWKFGFETLQENTLHISLKLTQNILFVNCYCQKLKTRWLKILKGTFQDKKQRLIFKRNPYKNMEGWRNAYTTDEMSSLNLPFMLQIFFLSV